MWEFQARDRRQGPQVYGKKDSLRAISAIGFSPSDFTPPFSPNAVAAQYFPNHASKEWGEILVDKEAGRGFVWQPFGPVQAARRAWLSKEDILA
jgi:hypothetical protein